MNKLWKNFGKLSGKCYTNMVTGNGSLDVWNQGFDTLMDIISEERSKDKDFAREMVDLDDSTDFQYDVCGWMEDYLDELDMREQYEKLQIICERLVKLFAWSEDSSSDLKFRIASAMKAQGKTDEALRFCEKWYKKETDNPQAVTALIYMRIVAGKLEEAEALVDENISEVVECDEENDIIFAAAAHLYEVNGNKKAAKRIDRAREEYDKRLEKFFLEMDDEEEEFGWDDEELPFS